VDAVVIRQGSRQTLKVTPELGRAVSVVPDLRGPAGRELNLRSAPFSLDLDAFGRGWFAPAGGRLGAAVMPLDDQLATYFGVAEGVLVTSVSANTPAAAAGLRAGDVIIAVGGRNVAEASEVNEAIRAVAPGAMVDIRVVREKKEITVTATLPRPERQRTGTRVTI
jgi:membrane-associated protease RseP (regulator of RpoE activity)